MVKNIKDIDIEDKKVIVRFDYNVPIKDGKILDTKKIDSSFKTLDYLIKNNCRVIILSHFGRIKKTSDINNNSLLPVYNYIKNLNKYDILFSEVQIGTSLDNMVKNMKNRQIILVENTRFLDLNGNLESECDTQISMYWAHLADVFINDAFASMHRSHASTTGIAKYLPSAIGFLAMEELNGLNQIIDNISHPFVVLMGGAKLNDKIKMIDSLCKKADYVLLGGGIANTFLSALGYNVGSSLYDKDSITQANNLLEKYNNKIIMPKDLITSPTYSDEIYEQKKADEIMEDDVIGDIGGRAVENYKKILSTAKTIFINGSVGIYEKFQFANGTKEILRYVSTLQSKKIIAGGDAASSVRQFKLDDKMDFISTGGGAALKYISDGTLTVLKAIEESNEKNLC